MVKAVHPNRNEKKLPTERRRYSYTPPDSVVVVAKPANIKAPSMLKTPARIHAAKIYGWLINVADMGAIFLNTPEPIIRPATIKIPVGKPSTRLSGIFDLSAVINVSSFWGMAIIADDINNAVLRNSR